MKNKYNDYVFIKIISKIKKDNKLDKVLVN